MTVCDDGHQEIVYEGRNCPLCASVQEVANLEDTIVDMKDKISELKDEISELRTQEE